MRLNEDKISHISHLLIDGAKEKKLIKILNPAQLLKQTKKILTDYCKLDEEVDEIVRKKLKSYSRKIGEGSREWDVLYQKHFQEEMKKRW